MQPSRSRQEIYRSFIDFIVRDFQTERRAANRRMFNVLLWCFIAPAIGSAVLLLLMKAHILAPSTKGYLQWLVLLFPISYSIYILSSEVISELPGAYRRGGIASTLNQAVKDAEWRERTCESLRSSAELSSADWDWVSTSFRIDLERLQSRNKYLTALAGVVFFFIMQGIDSLGDAEEKISWIKSPMGWIEAPSDNWYQFVGLAMFLVLFYLSGHQTYQALLRYWNCADLLKRRPAS